MQFLPFADLPLDRVFGPTLPVNPWPFRRRAVEEALRLAKARAPPDKLQIALNRVYKHFADGAEVELKAQTGVIVAKKGLRGAMRRLAWLEVGKKPG